MDGCWTGAAACGRVQPWGNGRETGAAARLEGDATRGAGGACGAVMKLDAYEKPTSSAVGLSIVSDPISLALDHLLRHQRPHGGWSGRNNSMMFCLPLYVGAAYVAKSLIDDDTKQGMWQFLRAYQMPDGGWPLHLEGQSSLMMTTAMCYVAA